MAHEVDFVLPREPFLIVAVCNLTNKIQRLLD